MGNRNERREESDATLGRGEVDGAFAAWSIEELEDDLDSLRSAFAEGDEAVG